MDAANQAPLYSMSIETFCRTAKYLLSQQDQVAFVHFCLNGMYKDGQVYLDANENAISDKVAIGLSRDYDSLLGIDSEIVVQRELTMYPVSRKEDTLSTNIHLIYHFECATVSSLYFSSHTLSCIDRAPLMHPFTRFRTYALPSGAHTT